MVPYVLCRVERLSAYLKLLASSFSAPQHRVGCVGVWMADPGCEKGNCG
jgi:hypothetical protein